VSSNCKLFWLGHQLYFVKLEQNISSRKMNEWLVPPVGNWKWCAINELIIVKSFPQWGCHIFQQQNRPLAIHTYIKQITLHRWKEIKTNLVITLFRVDEISVEVFALSILIATYVERLPGRLYWKLQYVHQMVLWWTQHLQKLWRCKKARLKPPLNCTM
jgi:hypothetical protein